MVVLLNKRINNKNTNIYLFYTWVLYTLSYIKIMLLKRKFVIFKHTIKEYNEKVWLNSINIQ